jgi:hypothetical protein
MGEGRGGEGSLNWIDLARNRDRTITKINLSRVFTIFKRTKQPIYKIKYII